MKLTKIVALSLFTTIAAYSAERTGNLVTFINGTDYPVEIHGDYSINGSDRRHYFSSNTQLQPNKQGSMSLYEQGQMKSFFVFIWLKQEAGGKRGPYERFSIIKPGNYHITFNNKVICLQKSR